jgi:hypothetical protein
MGFRCRVWGQGVGEVGSRACGGRASGRKQGTENSTRARSEQ